MDYIAGMEDQQAPLFLASGNDAPVGKFEGGMISYTICR